MHPFIRRGEYDRDELLLFIGSRQPQTGVIWGNNQPRCTIITSGGRHAQKSGYRDEKNLDGSWEYFGQGRSGDQLSTNAANRRLIGGTDPVLLFSTRELTSSEIRLRGNYRKRFKFEGSFNVSGYEIIVPDGGERAGDRLFRFHLNPFTPM
jgi:5-methylcytosine-specific restriction protein A